MKLISRGFPIRPVRLLFSMTVGALVVVGLSSPVEAKGPASVTIRGPGFDDPIELIEGAESGSVVGLMEQTGLWYATGDLPVPIDEPAGELGSGYTLTWTIPGLPDGSVEQRVIRQVIFPSAEGGPVVHTPDQEGLEGWGPGVIGWFAAPSGLLDTLSALGSSVPARSTDDGSLADSPINSGPGPSEIDNTIWYMAVMALALVIGWAWSRFLSSRVEQR